MDTSPFQQTPSPISNWAAPSGASPYPVLDPNHWGLSKSPIGTFAAPNLPHGDLQKEGVRNQAPPAAKSGCGCGSADQNPNRIVYPEQSLGFTSDVNLLSMNSEADSNKESGCGCGGKCDCSERGSAPRQGSQLSNDSQAILGTDVAQSSDATVDIMQHTPGSATLMTVISPSGNYYSATARIPTNGSINLVVNELESGQEIFNLTYPKAPNENAWLVAESGGYSSEKLIPRETPLSYLPIVGLAMAIVRERLSVKMEHVDSSKKPAASEDCPCVTHDLVCTPIGKSKDWPWTSDHLHFKWWAPCIGSFETDISACCKAHDIKLWCAHNRPDINGANYAVVACVVGSVINEAQRQLQDFDFFKKFFCEILISAWSALTIVPLGLIMIPVFDVGELLGSRPELFNFEHYNDCSCLCGGTSPTVQCGGIGWGLGVCHDLCKDYGLKEDCFNCFWTCSYDANGNIIRDKDNKPIRKPIGSSVQNCCPDTRMTCLPKSKAAPCPDKRPPCTNCWSFCWPDSKGSKCKGNLWWVKTGEAGTWQVCKLDDNLPCCDESLYGLHVIDSPCSYTGYWPPIK
jgi:hypothetical protein